MPWERLGGGGRVLPLPAYPFARQRHWVPLLEAEAEAAPPAAAAAQPVPSGPARADDAGQAVLAALCQVLGLEPGQLAGARSLRELGFHSIHALTLKHMLERTLGREVPLATLGEPRQSVAQLAAAVAALPGAPAPAADAERAPLLLPRPDQRYQSFPLTDVQEAFYVGSSLGAPGDSAYIYFELEIGRGVDLATLSASWQLLVARHDMLRAVIDADGRQRILEQVPAYRIRAVDWRRMDPQTRGRNHAALRARLERLAPAMAGWPRFDMQVSLHDEERRVLHFGIDELLADGPSAYRLVREWAQACRAPQQPAAPLEASFRDYVFALKAQEDRPEAAADLAYWVARLDRLAPAPALPLGGGRAAGPARVRLVHRLSPAQRAVLDEQAQAAGVSLTVLLLTLFSELLRACGAGPRFTLVLTHANRLPLHPQVPEIVGPVISTGLFVAGPSAGAGFDALARDYQQALWQDLDHMRVSGVRVLRELKARKRVAADAIFPVVFTSMLNSVAAPGEAGQGWPVSYALNRTPQVYLDHQVLDEGGALQLSWDVAQGYYADGLVERMFDAYRARVDELAAGRRAWDDAPFAGLRADPGADLRGLAVPARPEAAAEPFALTDQQSAYAFGRSGHAGAALACHYYQEVDTDDVDPDRLARAWAALMQRHPMLRALVGADGMQRVPAAAPAYRIREADLRALDAPARERALDAIRADMVGRNVALDAWPFFELRLTRCAGSACRIHLTVDMLIADGGSIVRVLNELLAAYQYPRRRAAAPALRFRDYQVAVQGFAGGQAQRDSLAYWNAKFAALPGAPRLSGATPGADAAPAHARVDGVLACWPALSRRAQALGARPGAVLLAAYLEVLSSFSERAPLAVVVPNWDRLPVHPGVHEVVGDFTALAWVAHGGEPLGLRERVLDVEAQLRADLAQRPVSGLAALRRRARQQAGAAPRFPVVFTGEMPGVELPADGRWSLVLAQSKTPGVHLDNISAARDDGLHCAWDYVPSIYPKPMVETMFGAYLALLEALGADGAAWEKTDLATSGHRQKI